MVTIKKLVYSLVYLPLIVGAFCSCDNSMEDPRLQVQQDGIWLSIRGNHMVLNYMKRMVITSKKLTCKVVHTCRLGQREPFLIKNYLALLCSQEHLCKPFGIRSHLKRSLLPIVSSLFHRIIQIQVQNLVHWLIL